MRIVVVVLSQLWCAAALPLPSRGSWSQDCQSELVFGGERATVTPASAGVFRGPTLVGIEISPTLNLRGNLKTYRELGRTVPRRWKLCGRDPQKLVCPRGRRARLGLASANVLASQTQVFGTRDFIDKDIARFLPFVETLVFKGLAVPLRDSAPLCLRWRRILSPPAPTADRDLTEAHSNEFETTRIEDAKAASMENRHSVLHHARRIGSRKRRTAAIASKVPPMSNASGAASSERSHTSDPVMSCQPAATPIVTANMLVSFMVLTSWGM